LVDKIEALRNRLAIRVDEKGGYPELEFAALEKALADTAAAIDPGGQAE
jgi:hypothetical protein